MFAIFLNMLGFKEFFICKLTVCYLPFNVYIIMYVLEVYPYKKIAFYIKQAFPCYQLFRLLIQKIVSYPVFLFSMMPFTTECALNWFQASILPKGMIHFIEIMLIS